MDIPFSALSLVHQNLTHLMSSNDDKFDFLDSNRIPYAIKFNPEIPNFFSVADENGFIKFFSSFPKLKPVKEFSAQKSCIYDLQWLNSHEIACGGGDQYVSIFDVNTCTRLALLKGHTESVKSIAQLPMNPFVLASGSRDGSVLIFDVRFNRSADATDPDVSYIRAVNNIQKAHFVEDFPSHNLAKACRSNVLKAKHNNSSQSVNSALKKPSPVASVLFQNDNLLISAGATDGLIKVWDIRKIYSASSTKKSLDQTPLYIFSNQAGSNPFMPSSHSGSKISKGYSNIVLNHSGTRVYANCMNSSIYEYNLVTCNQSHTRVMNSYNIYRSNLLLQQGGCESSDGGEEARTKNRYHVNQSNYIKSSISQCDNFILTGSSDFNAYIYSTNKNMNCDKFRKYMPVIVLRGHTNEVTAVDWNPLDSNQLVTCSDDNTIRLWNVRRDLDTLKANECNFCLAETIDEFEEGHNLKETANNHSEQNNTNQDANFISGLRNRKYFPFTTGMYDDLIFTSYEFKNFVKQKSPGDDSSSMQFTNDLEKELCMKWKNIDISRRHETGNSSPASSPTSLLIKSIENELLDKPKTAEKIQPEFHIIQLDTPTSNMPVNILNIPSTSQDMDTQPATVGLVEHLTKEDQNNENITKKWLFRRQASSTTLVDLQPESRIKAKKKPLKQSRHPVDHSLPSPHTKLLRANNGAARAPSQEHLATTTAKKRNAVDPIEALIGESSGDNGGLNEPRTPVSKRRLIVGENMANSPCSPRPSTNIDSPVRTILHYFSPKPPPK